MLNPVEYDPDSRQKPTCQEVVESLPWVGQAADRQAATVDVAHDFSDRIFIRGGVEFGSYLFDAEGNWLG